MQPAALTEFASEYCAGELPDELLMKKWGMTPSEFNERVRIGYGTFLAPNAFVRLKNTGGKGARHSAAVSNLAKEGELMPEDMALSPLEAVEMMSPLQRMRSYVLSEPELAFANLVLKGFNTTSAAVACFDVYDKFEAQRKASNMLRDERISAYIAEMKGQRLYAPPRGRAYLEAVLWQVIDRSMELQQAYEENGRPIAGRCTYNPKALLGSAALLMKLKGWDGQSDNVNTAETHVERLRRINLNKKKD